MITISTFNFFLLITLSCIGIAYMYRHAMDSLTKTMGKMKMEYGAEDEHYCTHCEKITKHRCYYSDHERDSSADFFTCLTCGWEYHGVIGEYRSPDKA